MPETPIRSLDARARKRFENAKLAVERGNFEYTIEICSELLSETPGCLEARQLLRRAQQSSFAAVGSGIAKAIRVARSRILTLYGSPYIRKEPTKAMWIGEKALALHPFNAQALSLVASGAERLRLFETSVFCLKNVCADGQADFALMHRYCESLIQIGETNEAIAIAERLAKLRPESGSVQELMKSASVAHSINKGKWAEEEQDFRSKLKDSDLAESLERSNRVVSDGDAAAARLQDLVAAVRSDPQNADLYKRIVRLQIAAEDYRSALDWLKKAFLLPQSESDIALRQMQGELEIRAVEQELAILRQRAASEGDASSQSRKRIRLLEAELGQLRLEDARKMVEQFPNDFGQRLKYGTLLLEAEQVDEAIQQFQVSQRSANLKLRSHVMLGRSFMAKGLFDLALEQLDLAIAGSVAMDAFKKEVLYISANCCEELGRPDEAFRRYKLVYASDIGFRDVAAKIDSYYGSGDEEGTSR